MTNVELKAKIDEIIAIEDYFDRIVAINNFEKEYKGSDFFKNTKKDLKELVKEYRMDNLLSLKTWIINIQKGLNNLDFTNIDEILEKVADTFEKENLDINTTIKNFKETFNKD